MVNDELNITPESDLSGIQFETTSRAWKRPKMLSLENLKGVLSVVVTDEILSERNVTSLEPGQEQDPTAPPNTFKVSNRAHISIDDNYIYVWVPSKNVWKRALLSTW